MDETFRLERMIVSCIFLSNHSMRGIGHDTHGPKAEKICGRARAPRRTGRAMKVTSRWLLTLWLLSFLQLDSFCTTGPVRNWHVSVVLVEA